MKVPIIREAIPVGIEKSFAHSSKYDISTIEEWINSTMYRGFVENKENIFKILVKQERRLKL